MMNFQPNWITPNYLDIPENTPDVKGCRFVITPQVAKELIPLFPTTPVTYDSLRNCFNNICENGAVKVAIMEDGKKQTLSPHSLRKTFRSIGADLGESDDILEAVISHKNGRGKVTEAYLRRSIPSMVPVATRVADYLQGVMTGAIEPNSWHVE
jgi:integrase